MRSLDSKHEDQYRLPKDMIIRPLVVSDLSQAAALEAAAFPPEQTASPESIKDRITVCPEICCGIFKREYNRENKNGETETANEDSSVVSKGSNLVKEELVAMVLSTKIKSEFIQEEDMVPGSHVEDGRTIGLHSLCVAEKYRHRRLAHIILADYIQKMFGSHIADSITLLCRPKLRGMYESAGFTFKSVSDVTHGGVEWCNMQVRPDTYEEQLKSHTPK